MAFKKNENQQLSFDDSYARQSDRAKKYLANSWAESFAKEIFPRINEERFRVLYSEQQFSRPNTPVNVIIGALILKEMNQLTDDELLESILFDVRYQYALHTTSFKEQPFSDRTVSRFRVRLLEYERETGVDLLKEEMLSLADVFVQHLGMDTRKKRMDSLMVAMNCKKMTQMEVTYTSIAQLAKYLTKQKIAAKGFEKYLDTDNRTQTLYKVKPGEIPERLVSLVEDGYGLLKMTPEAHREAEAYRILQRHLEDQTEEIDGKYTIRDRKKISPSSLHSPFDPDATYRRKGGKKYLGYVGNIVETVERKDETTRAIITDFDYQRNIYSDIQFCKDVLEKMGTQEQNVQLVVDGAYFSRENAETAAAQNIELVAGSMLGTPADPLFADFEVDTETNLITKCPMGHIPCTSQMHCNDSTRMNDRRYYITFETAVCENCPHKGTCHVDFKKTKAGVSISETAIKRAKYAKKMSTDEYNRLIRFRAGVEGVPSVLRRKYKIDKIPDRGYLRTKLWFTVKIGAMNARRLIMRSKVAPSFCFSLKNNVQNFFMMLFYRYCAKVGVLTS